MLVIVASRQDEAARLLAARWSAHDAALLTCEDLSVAGWRHLLDQIGLSDAVVSGQPVAVKEITGVLTRLPCVYEHELSHIVPTDRAYVAAEMTAFLACWLSELTCPVLNRPTPTCLMGPNWRPEQWVHAAARLGMPRLPLHREASRLTDSLARTPDRPLTTLTVVGSRSFGAADVTLAAQAQRLAAAAGVDLLAVHFSGPERGAEFVGADLFPDVASADIAEAILEYLSGRSSC